MHVPAVQHEWLTYGMPLCFLGAAMSLKAFYLNCVTCALGHLLPRVKLPTCQSSEGALHSHIVLRLYLRSERHSIFNVGGGMLHPLPPENTAPGAAAPS